MVNTPLVRGGGIGGVTLRFPMKRHLEGLKRNDTSTDSDVAGPRSCQTSEQ